MGNVEMWNHGKKCAHNKKLQYKELQENIVEVHQNYTQENSIHEFRAEKTRSAIFRARAKWMQERERMSKYLFALEKSNYLNKSMNSTYINGQLSRDTKLILKEQDKFYKKPIKADSKIYFGLTSYSGIELNHQEHD